MHAWQPSDDAVRLHYRWGALNCKLFRGCSQSLSLAQPTLADQIEYKKPLIHWQVLEALRQEALFIQSQR
jgi:hypothetical protein